MAKSRSHKDQMRTSHKIAKITREERTKPKGKRLSRKAVLGKAFGILRHEKGGV